MAVIYSPALLRDLNGRQLQSAIDFSPARKNSPHRDGTWASVKVSGTGGTFIPTSLTLNGRLVARHPATAPFPEVTCTTTSHPEGTLTFTGFLVPPHA